MLCGPCTPQNRLRKERKLGRCPASGSALPAWEQEVQSSKHQRGRQHPAVLALEVQQGPLRTSFPNRTCLLQAGPPSAQPLRPNPAAASQWAAEGLTRLPVRTQLQTLLRSRAMAAYRNPTVPLASKATGKHVPHQPNCGGERRAEAGPLPTSGPRARGRGWGTPGVSGPGPSPRTEEQDGTCPIAKGPSFTFSHITQRSNGSELLQHSA